jgi:hypothetical protein
MVSSVETMVWISLWLGNVDVDWERVEMEKARGWGWRGGEGENSVGVWGCAGLIQLISGRGSAC